MFSVLMTHAVRVISSSATLPFALCAAAALLQAPSAHAQSAPQAPVSPPPDRSQEAEALVQQGVAQRRAGQDQPALESFRRAFEIAPSPRIQAQIALAEQALGQWVDADRDLRAALSARDDTWIQRNTGALEAALNAIAARIATIELTCSTAGARLFANGREVGAFPLAQPLRVEAGTVAIEVRREGYRTARRAIDVEGGRSYRESFTLVEITVEDPEPTITARGNGRRQGPVGPVTPPDPPAPASSWALIGAGAGMLVVGAIGHGYWQNRVALYNSNVIPRADGGFEEGCFFSTATYPRRSDRCGAVLSESWAGFGLAVTGYALGVAGVASGLVIRFTHRAPRAEQSAPQAPATATLSCTPSLGLVGAQCFGTF